MKLITGVRCVERTPETVFRTVESAKRAGLGEALHFFVDGPFDRHRGLAGASPFQRAPSFRRAGLAICADTTIRLRHIGKHGFTWEEAGAEPRRYATYTYQLK